jgi:hypothetical protein
MTDLPPPSYEGAVGNSNPDPRAESGVLIIHLGGLAAEALIYEYGPMLNFVGFNCATVGCGAEERDRLIEIGDHLEGECEVHAEMLSITHLIRMGYRFIDKTRVRSDSRSAYSRISFVRDPLWKA